MKLGVIGAGNMARAIITGLLQKEVFPPGNILVSRRNQEALQVWKEELGVEITEDNLRVIKEAEIILLAVKPQMMSSVIGEIRDSIRKDQLFISIAAGKTIPWFEEEFGKKIKLIRSMPNTPAMVGEGCTGYCCNEEVTAGELSLAEKIFNSYGTSYQLQEKMMDTFTALAGSGPAFVFMFMEAMADAAVYGGMTRQAAYEIAAQTVLGSGRLLQATGSHPGSLKDMVCSPGGTTICGVKSLEEGRMRATIMEAINSCIEKARKL